MRQGSRNRSSSTSGPVHLNFPFREPLIPKLDDDNLFQLTERPNGYVNVHNGDLTIDQDEIKEIAGIINKHEKGIIVCGQIENEKFAACCNPACRPIKLPDFGGPTITAEKR